jgi:adenylyltransferase/sulfurtransferase
MFSTSVPEISVQELKRLIDGDQAPLLLDVREEREYAIANLQGTLIPLQQLPNRLEEIETHREKPIVVYCRSGSRSAQAVRYMQSLGFAQVKNLKGGILAWSRDIDPTMPIY